MRTYQKIATSLVATIVAISPFVPLVAHAATSATIIGNIDARLSSDASTTGAGMTFETKPIVITRANIRIGSDTQTAGTDATSSESLQTHAKALISEDTKVSSVELSGDKVAISYQEPAKLFGFIQITIPVTVAVTASGATSIQYPWYSFLLSSDRASLAVRARDATAPELTVKTNASAKFSVTEQEHILDSLHEVLRSQASGDVQANAALQ